MRYLFILLMSVSFSSFAVAQDEHRETTLNIHYYPFSYSDSRNLKVIFDKVSAKLKSSSDLRATVIYYKGYRQNKINFNKFRLKVQSILVKSNKIEPSRVQIISDTQKKYTSSFDIWIIDKEGKPIRDW
jgi:hypothetical protein